jgi:hypothetical protein
VVMSKKSLAEWRSLDCSNEAQYKSRSSLALTLKQAKNEIIYLHTEVERLLELLIVTTNKEAINEDASENANSK